MEKIYQQKYVKCLIINDNKFVMNNAQIVLKKQHCDGFSERETKQNKNQVIFQCFFVKKCHQLNIQCLLIKYNHL